MRNKILYGLLVLTTSALIVGSVGCANEKNRTGGNTTTAGSSLESHTSFEEDTVGTERHTSSDTSSGITGNETSEGEDKTDTVTSDVEKESTLKPDKSETDTDKKDNTTTEGGNNQTTKPQTSPETTTKPSGTTTKPEITTKPSGTNTKPETTTAKPSDSTTTTTGSSSDEYEGLKNYPKPEVSVGITSSDTVDSAAAKIIAKNVKSSMTTAEKVKIIHDYLVYTVDYDVEGLNEFNKTNDWSVFDDSVFEAKGALINKVAVCQGYAEAFKVLMDKLGINNIIVYGTADGVSHAWNLVEIDGYWYHVDVTYDDPTTRGKDSQGNDIDVVVKNGENILYNYLLTTESIISENHVIDKSETIKSNAGISSYPSKVNSEKYLNMVYPWVEISGMNEFDKVQKYFDNGIYTVRVVVPSTMDIGNNSEFWKKIGECTGKAGGGKYSGTMTAHGSKTIIFVKITLN